MLTALRLIARHPTRGKQSLVAARPVHADQIVASYMVSLCLHAKCKVSLLVQSQFRTPCVSRVLEDRPSAVFGVRWTNQVFNC
jgi:hypothetical protein